MSNGPHILLSDLPRPFLRTLVKEHLHVNGRLHLFQANADLAAAVLQEVDSIKLVLNGYDGQAASINCLPTDWDAGQQDSGTMDSCSLRGGTKTPATSASSIRCSKQEACGHTLQAMLSAACQCSLHVDLWGAFPAQWQFLPKASVTHLTLTGITLTAHVLQHQLQLNQCHQLHTITLKGQCRSQLTASEIASWSAEQRTAVIPLSLTHLQLTDDVIDDECIEAWAQLLSAQLTHLTLHTRGFQRFPACLGPTHLHLPNGLTEGIMESLITAPQITHITASDCHLFRDHCSQWVSWQQLQLTSNHWGPDMSRLLHLPLQHIQRLVIHHLHCDIGSSTNSSHNGTLAATQAVARLATCRDLQCVPRQAARPGIQGPTFMLRGNFTSEIITLCAEKLTGDGCLVLDVSPAGTHMLSGISHLPNNMHKLCLGCYIAHSHLSAEQQADELQFWQQLPTALPSHITELVLDFSSHFNSMQCGRFLAALLPAAAAAGRLGILSLLAPASVATNELQLLLQAYPVRMECRKSKPLC